MTAGEAGPLHPRNEQQVYQEAVHLERIGHHSEAKDLFRQVLPGMMTRESERHTSAIHEARTDEVERSMPLRGSVIFEQALAAEAMLRRLREKRSLDK